MQIFCIKLKFNYIAEDLKTTIMQTFKITKELIERHFDEYEHQMYFQIKNQLRPTFILTDLKDIDLERMTAKIRYRWVNDEAEVYHEQIKLTYE